jgi:hypothetical protein
VSDIGPQLVALNPMDAQADHHAIVQLGDTASSNSILYEIIVSVRTPCLSLVCAPRLSMTTAPAEAPTITEPISGNPHFFPMNWNITIAAVIVIDLAAVGFTLYSAEVTTL